MENSNEFKWTNDLAKEFCEYAGLRIGKKEDIREQLNYLIIYFIKSKEVKKEMDYEILTYSDIQKTIRSVKRLSDNSTWTIGDDTQLGKISKFEIIDGTLRAFTDYRINVWYDLSILQKVKSLFTKEQEQEIISIIKRYV